MGESFSDREIEEAVAFGAFDNLRNLERQGFFRQGGLTLRNPKDPESFKVRRAKVGGFRDYFTAAQVAELEELVRTPPVADASATSPAPPPARLAVRCDGRPAAVGCRHARRSSRRCGGSSAPHRGDARARLAAARRQARRQRPGRGGGRGARLAVRAQDAALAATLRDSQKPRFRATLDHVDRGPLRAARAALARPDPDHRPASVHGRAVDQGSSPPDGRRIVLFGKPSGMMARFDLVVAGAEVQLPPLPNVLPIRLPLMRARGHGHPTAAAQWRPRLAALPRPLIALLVGGPTVPFVFDRTGCRPAAVGSRTEIAAAGGTPYVTTSRRTPARGGRAALRARLPERARLFEWTPETRRQPLSRPARPGRRLHRHRRQRLDAGRGGARPQAAGDPGAAARPLRRHRPGAPQPVRAGCSSPMAGVWAARRGRGDAAPGCSPPRATFGHFTRCCSMPGLPCAPASRSLPPKGAVPDDLPAVVARIKGLIDARTPADVESRGS